MPYKQEVIANKTQQARYQASVSFDTSLYYSEWSRTE